MRKYTLDTQKYDYDEIYANEVEHKETEYAARLQALYDTRITHYRTKTIKSGKFLECEVYPIWNTNTSISRAKRTHESRNVQKELNKKNAIKRLIRLVNTNFTDDDIWGTFTYETKRLPKSIEEAQKEFSKFIRRLKYWCSKHGYPPLKYVYVIEFEDDVEKGKKRVHHHIICNFPDRDVAEELWRGGARRHTRRLQADNDGYEGLVRYILKDPKGTKRYVTSKNLQQPQITIADYKFTRKKINAIVSGKITAQSVFEPMYKGYAFHRASTYTSDYCSGAYVYIKMVRLDIPQGGKKSASRRE